MIVIFKVKVIFLFVKQIYREIKFVRVSVVYFLSKI